MNTESENLIEMLENNAAEGKLVLSTIEGFVTVSVSDFIVQPTEGILYDLNRGHETTNALIRSDSNTLPKIRLINDYAVGEVITALKNRIYELENK